MKVLSRIVALGVAVALVVGALAVRGERAADPLAVGGDDEGGDGPVAGAVICPSDLRVTCDAVEAELPQLTVVRRPSAEVADEASAGLVDGVWLVPAAWADIVDDARGRAAVAAEPLVRSAPVATSPVRMLGPQSRVEALAAVCGQPIADVELSCLARLVDEPWPAPFDANGWGRVGVAVPPPETTTGLMATATVAAAVAGPDFGARELGVPATVEALRRFEGSVTGDDQPGRFGVAGRLRAQGPSFASFVIEAEALLGPDQDQDAVTGRELLVGFPARPRLDVLLVVVGDEQAAVDDVATALTSDEGVRALGELGGWRTGAADVDSRADRPDGPSLTALRIAWSDIAG